MRAMSPLSIYCHMSTTPLLNIQSFHRDTEMKVNLIKASKIVRGIKSFEYSNLVQNQPKCLFSIAIKIIIYVIYHVDDLY